jgi:hypothetical protein
MRRSVTVLLLPGAISTLAPASASIPKRFADELRKGQPS